MRVEYIVMSLSVCMSAYISLEPYICYFVVMMEEKGLQWEGFVQTIGFELKYALSMLDKDRDVGRAEGVRQRKTKIRQLDDISSFWSISVAFSNYQH